MKPQQFNLELWLHLGKPDCAWTRSGVKVFSLEYFPDVRQDCSVLCGVIGKNGYLSLWMKNGRDAFFKPQMNIDFSPDDLMLHLESQSSPWLLNAPKRVKR